MYISTTINYNVHSLANTREHTHKRGVQSQLSNLGFKELYLSYDEDLLGISQEFPSIKYSLDFVCSHFHSL